MARKSGELSDDIERAAAPLPDEDTQRPFMVPLGHDPYDIWHHILDKVTDHGDVLTLWDVCPLFREIGSLQKKYVETRLPEIVELISEFLVEHEEDDEDYLGDVRPSTLILLDLRLICKLCKSSVEGLLQTRGYGKLYLTLKTSGQVQEIIDDIMGEEIEADCFFPPNVNVSIPYVGNVRNQVAVQERVTFIESIGILVELIGERMNTLEYRDAKDTPHGMYSRIREWVVKMPNLEHLFLGTYWNARRVQPTAFEEIPAFPHCPKLKSFCSWSNMLPKEYLEHIFEANPLIKELGLCGRDQELSKAPAPNISLLPHLEKIDIPPFDSILNRLDFNFPLKELELNGVHNRRKTITSSQLFVFLHQFKDSLEHLRLCLHVEETGEYYLDLPNLKYLSWNYNKTFKDLEFLRHAVRLEQLRMYPRESNIRNFDGFCNRFLKQVTQGFEGMSLFEVLPQLKRFNISFAMEDRVFCRP